MEVKVLPSAQHASQLHSKGPGRQGVWSLFNEVPFRHSVVEVLASFPGSTHQLFSHCVEKQCEKSWGVESADKAIEVVEIISSEPLFSS